LKRTACGNAHVRIYVASQRRHHQVHGASSGEHDARFRQRMCHVRNSSAAGALNICARCLRAKRRRHRLDCARSRCLGRVCAICMGQVPQCPTGSLLSHFDISMREKSSLNCLNSTSSDSSGNHFGANARQRAQRSTSVGLDQRVSSVRPQRRHRHLSCACSDHARDPIPFTRAVVQQGEVIPLQHDVFSVHRERSQHNIKHASSDHVDAELGFRVREGEQRVTGRLLHGRAGRMLAHDLHRASEVRALARLRHAATSVRGGRHVRLERRREDAAAAVRRRTPRARRQ
jgi:hypothetical protein